MQLYQKLLNGNQIDTTSSHIMWSFSKSTGVYSCKQEDREYYMQWNALHSKVRRLFIKQNLPLIKKM